MQRTTGNRYNFKIPGKQTKPNTATAKQDSPPKQRGTSKKRVQEVISQQSESEESSV